ncbi:MAG: TrmH family RNA methyltransferase [Myxococcota bacterium]
MQRRRDWWIKQYEHDIIRSKHHEPGRFPFVLVLDQLKASYNVAKILRSANAMGAREVHLVRIGRFDPTPGKGALRHTRTVSYDDISASLRQLRDEGYAIYALHVGGREVLGRATFPEKTAFILGHEEWGLSFNPADHPEVTTLRIPQFGIVQSLNVSIAASLVGFEWLRQHAPLEEAREIPPTDHHAP